MSKIRNLVYDNTIVEKPIFNGVPLKKWINIQDGQEYVIWEDGGVRCMPYIGTRSSSYRPCFWNDDEETINDTDINHNLQANSYIIANDKFFALTCLQTGYSGQIYATALSKDGQHWIKMTPSDLGITTYTLSRTLCFMIDDGLLVSTQVSSTYYIYHVVIDKELNVVSTDMVYYGADNLLGTANSNILAPNMPYNNLDYVYCMNSVTDEEATTIVRYEKNTSTGDYEWVAHQTNTQSLRKLYKDGTIENCHTTLKNYCRVYRDLNKTGWTWRNASLTTYKPMAYGCYIAKGEEIRYVIVSLTLEQSSGNRSELILIMNEDSDRLTPNIGQNHTTMETIHESTSVKWLAYDAEVNEKGEDIVASQLIVDNQSAYGGDACVVYVYNSTQKKRKKSSNKFYIYARGRDGKAAWSVQKISQNLPDIEEVNNFLADELAINRATDLAKRAQNFSCVCYDDTDGIFLSDSLFQYGYASNYVAIATDPTLKEPYKNTFLISDSDYI